MKTEKQYCKWMELFMDSWKNLEGVKTTSYLSKDVKYYETPMGSPCTTWAEVEALWAVVPKNQKNIDYKYKVVCFNDDFCVFNWQMGRDILINGDWKHQKIDGIFQVSLNADGNCTFFKQWRNTETN